MNQAWQKAENYIASYLCLNNIKTAVTNNKLKQYDDIDLICTPCPFGREFTVSVKLQNRALETGNFSFEIWLVDDEGNKIPGNFTKCKADYVAIAMVHEDSPQEALVYFWSHLTLKDYLEAHPELPQKGLGWKAKSTNTYRKYKDVVNVLVPVKDITDLAIHTVRIPFIKDSYSDKAILKTHILSNFNNGLSWIKEIFV